LAGLELNYIVTEKEFLAIVHAINKFRHCIIDYQIFVHSDHATIRHLMNKEDASSRVIIWLLSLQEFDLNIVDKLGGHNVVVDFL
jgi:hypothetical protein